MGRQTFNVKTIERRLGEMSDLVKLVGSGYSGHWEITPPSEQKKQDGSIRNDGELNQRNSFLIRGKYIMARGKAKPKEQKPIEQTLWDAACRCARTFCRLFLSAESRLGAALRPRFPVLYPSSPAIAATAPSKRQSRPDFTCGGSLHHH